MCYYPSGRGREFLDLVGAFGVRLTRGSHPVLAARTFCIEHLGNVSVVDAGKTLEALARASGGTASGPGGPSVEARHGPGSRGGTEQSAAMFA